MSQSIDQAPSRLKARLEALSEEHQRGTLRFYRRVEEFTQAGLLTKDQAAIVTEHLFRLGERGRNPANTGNIEDLFCHTLSDTKDPIRAYAQALADSVAGITFSVIGVVQWHRGNVKSLEGHTIQAALVAVLASP